MSGGGIRIELYEKWENNIALDLRATVCEMMG
jgi:hypothetical protein